MTLERQGFNCWIAPRNVTPGALYADEIVRAINAAKVLVLELSQTAIESPHVRREIERASSKGRPIITLKVDATSLTTALEYFLSESQWVDLTVDGSEVAFAKRLVAVRRHLMPVPVMQQRGKATARSAERPTHPSSAAKPNRRLGRPLVVVALAAIVIVVCMTLQIHAAIISSIAVAEGDEEGAWRIGEQLRNVAGGRPGRAPAAAFTEWDALTLSSHGIFPSDYWQSSVRPNYLEAKSQSSPTSRQYRLCGTIRMQRNWR
jgi:hypothetical protein